MTPFKIATRQSPMAMYQATFIQQQLQQYMPDREITLVGMTTIGDEHTQVALSDIGGKDVFVKTLQKALLDHQADIAVHCIKDMSVHPTPSLCLAAICQRDDPRDVFVSCRYNSLDELPPQATIGTASPRRHALLLHHYPHLRTQLIRGNVNSRLQKLDDGDYDGLILAAAGLHRLNMQTRINQYLDPAIFIPAIAQGALGIECRADDQRTIDYIRHLDHTPTHQCVIAERTVNRILLGDCHAAIGAFATLSDNQLQLNATVLSTDGKKQLCAMAQGTPSDAKNTGASVAQQLIQQGAKVLLAP